MVLISDNRKDLEKFNVSIEGTVIDSPVEDAALSSKCKSTKDLSYKCKFINFYFENYRNKLFLTTEHFYTLKMNSIVK